MAKKKEDKTNVMRVLEQQGVAYTPHFYTHPEGAPFDGLEVARALGQDPARVLKTLVTHGAQPKQLYVFVVPVQAELDLKAAARAAGVKAVAMLHVKDLFAATGYVRGGCSPIGMKKAFPTVIDDSARLCERIYVSGGKIGTQVELAPDELQRVTGACFASIVAHRD